jgi:hypothetical protein
LTTTVPCASASAIRVMLSAMTIGPAEGGMRGSQGVDRREIASSLRFSQ